MQIQSHFQYGLLIWGNMWDEQKVTKINKIQNTCLKLIVVHNDINTMYEILELFRIKDLIQLETINFGYRIINKQLPDWIQHIIEHDASNKTLKTAWLCY